ncbi:20591_t:CDS:2 [Dentiscutata erythropus]|uniref:20591_t:CDS:1 n=1 Tax=Dentiscutata erythropus TaxID=1348616 RepID=A0A9N9GL60_9GLOM|nr:20591_t:CDS:2 [Dentiscutata erythropus]
MPQIENIIVNTYQRALYFSLQVNFTFLLHHQLLNQNKALAIAFVNNNYYVAITLKPGAPVSQLLINSHNLQLQNHYDRSCDADTEMKWVKKIPHESQCPYESQLPYESQRNFAFEWVGRISAIPPFLRSAKNENLNFLKLNHVRNN